MTDQIQPTFSAGELSPSLYARVDLDTYHKGLATCRNWFVDYRGGVSNRAGTEFVAKCLSHTEGRLIRFQFNTLQTYILEFGNLYMRVIKDGALVTETAKAITIINKTAGLTAQINAHGYVTGDEVYFTGLTTMTELNGLTYKVGATTTNTFQIVDSNGTALNPTLFTDYTGVSNGTAARIYRLATPWVASDLPLLKFSQSTDTLTLTHPSYPIYDITRTGHAAWTLTKVEFTVAIGPPASGTVTSPTSGSTGYAYVVTSVDVNGNESVASEPFTAFDLVNISATAGTVRVTWAAVVGAIYYKLYKASPVVQTGRVASTGSTFGFIASVRGLSYEDLNITPDFAFQPPMHLDPFAANAITSITVTTPGTGVPDNATITITDSGGTGTLARARPVVTPGSGAVSAVILEDGGRNYTTPVATISAGTAVLTVAKGPATGTFPSISGYFQQRKYYANTANEPQRFWMSQPGLFKNFDKSNPVKDDDSISGQLASQEVNDIRWAVPMPSGLIFLTGAGAWQITGAGQAGSALTPRSVNAAPQAYNGVGQVKPLVVNFDILYVQALGATVRNLTYNFFANVYTGEDITVLSNHLLFNQSIRSWAYAEEPFKIVWAARSDGALLSLTFLKEQKINGWARHDTDGLFREVESIVEGSENAVYFLVRRTINGSAFNYIERLASRQFSLVENAWFVDSGVLYEGGPTGTLLGLDHLEGKTVAILSSGEVLPQRTVVNGRVSTGTVPVTKAIIGLPISSQCVTLQVDTGQPTIAGRRKKVAGATIRVDRSRKLKYGLVLTDLFYIPEPLKIDFSEYDLFSGDLRVNLPSNWDTPGQICWQMDDPMPATVLGVVLEFHTGDTSR